MIKFAITAAALLSLAARIAQAQDMSACQDSFAFPDLESGSVDFPSYDTSNFATTITYDPTSCAGVSLDPANLRNDQANGDIDHECARIEFDGSGSQTITCDKVAGEMATYGTWSIPDGTLCANGCMPWFDGTPDFVVTRSDNPSASGAYRRRAIQYQLGEMPHPDLQCARKRQTTCKVPGRNSWECIDTRSKLDSCGGCPGSEESKDCSEIYKAAEVSCLRGSCYVHTCLPGFVVTPDGAACVPK